MNWKNIKRDLVLLEMKDFDIILGMDLLSKNHKTICRFEKNVIFQYPSEEDFLFLWDKDEAATSTYISSTS